MRAGPCPERLRQLFEGVIRRSGRAGSGGRCRPSSVPGRPCTTASGSGVMPKVFEALLEDLTTEAAKRGEGRFPG